MKTNRFFTFDSCLRKLFLTFMMPMSVLATHESVDGDFCREPEAIQEQLDVSAVTSSLKNIHNLGAINERGSLRILLQKKTNACVISQTERKLIQEFAHINDLDLYWIYVDNEWELLPELIKGNGDIIVAQDQSLSASIQDHINFTHSWTNAAYRIVERAGNNQINKSADLAGRKIAIYKSSPVWNTLLELGKLQTAMVLQEIPLSVSHQEVMQRVKTGEYDLAVADSLFLDNYLPLNSELQANFSLSNERNMAWAARSDDGELHKTLNQYLNKQHLTHDVATIYFDDLSLIKDRGILRVITNTNPSHYYLQKGKLRGFEYELLRGFASQHMLRVDVVLANSQEEMFALLKEGKGDVIAASLPGSLLNTDDLIQYTAPYNYASSVIVGREADDVIIDVRDLTGRRIALADDSPLNKALNTFIEKEYRSANYNVLHAKYFKQPQINKTKDRLTRFSSLSPYDAVTQHYSDKYGFDWCLITALMFQEGQFNPNAYLYAGAEGLMQLIPATAELMGISDSNNAESSIYAGVRYLNYLRSKFKDALLLQDRMWFTLASYNAGYGRVKRARALTEKMGLDKNKWFDNVELAMMALAKPYIKNGEQVRYCRCGQTVVYVREIRTRYFNYIRLIDMQEIASLAPSDKKANYLRSIN